MTEGLRKGVGERDWEGGWGRGNRGAERGTGREGLGEGLGEGLRERGWGRGCGRCDRGAGLREGL